MKHPRRNFHGFEDVWVGVCMRLRLSAPRFIASVCTSCSMHCERPAFSRGNACPVLCFRGMRARIIISALRCLHGISKETFKQGGRKVRKKNNCLLSVRSSWNRARRARCKRVWRIWYLLSKIGYVSVVSTFNRAPYVFSRILKFERCVTWHSGGISSWDIFLK